MIRTYLLPVLAVIGLFVGLRTALTGFKTPPPGQPFAAPASSPFASFVAGTGIIEPASENIAIASEISGVVSEVLAEPGDSIAAGAPLFRIDDRAQKAEVAVRQAALQVEAQQLEESQQQLKVYSNLADARSVSALDLIERRSAVSIGVAKLDMAKAELLAAETDLERHTVRSPVDAEVLQVNVRAGEFAAAESNALPLMIIGTTTPLHVRVDVDENDAWRVKSGAPAKCYLRGNKSFEAPLEFVYFEPYVVPKRSLTGDSTERVDTRVMQIVYKLEPKKLPAFVGQLVDVFIDAPTTEVNNG